MNLIKSFLDGWRESARCERFRRAMDRGRDERIARLGRVWWARVIVWALLPVSITIVLVALVPQIIARIRYLNELKARARRAGIL